MITASYSIKTDVCKEEKGDLFGLFFEDINHAADGGLYAEMIQNRSFEFDPIDRDTYHSLYAWEKKGDCTLTICTETPYSVKNPHYLRITANTAESGVINEGFIPGLALHANETYAFSCYSRGDSFIVRITDKDGHIYDSRSFDSASMGEASRGDWKKYTAVFTMCDKNDWEGRLEVVLSKPGMAEFDFISLFPTETYKNRPKGLRKDLAEMLEAMKPKFLRFPGGCLVHDGDLDPNARNSMYRWKNTIGPIEDRPARRNNWGYNQTLGLGYYEYFQLAEDIGAEPLPVLPAAYDPHHQRKVPLDALGPWIDDALDLIEFANGDETTVWGKKRIELGHKEPFHLKYLAIGNEEVGEGFTERYPYFHRAIRQVYPDIKIIGSGSPFASGAEYERGWNCSKEFHSDYVDEHYYMNTDWMIANMDRYDSFSKDDPKVFLGEYATWGNEWFNALTEAAYMTQLENNAHAVGLACYAPLFANIHYVNWRPDMIWFDNHQVYGSANYYVQKVFMEHQGTHTLSYASSLTEEGARTQQAYETATLQNAKPIAGGIYLKGNEADAFFGDITVTNLITKESIVYPSLSYKQEEADKHSLGQYIGTIPDNWTQYTISCTAVEQSGYRGFLLTIGSEQDHYAWTIGGWQNFDIAIDHFVEGRGACLGEALFVVEKGRTYQLKLEVNNRNLYTWVDGIQYLTCEDRLPIIRPFYLSSSFDTQTNDVIIKLVNLKAEEATAELRFEGLSSNQYPASFITMAFGKNAQNTMEQPLHVVPASEECLVSNSLTYTAAPLSLTIIRIHTK